MIIRLSIVIACLCFLCSPVYSTVYYVAPDGSGDYANIQFAINATSNGDTVLLGDGIFTGTWNWNLNLNGHEIVLTSVNGRDSSIIDCGAGAGGYQRGIIINSGEGSGTVIEDLTIRNARTSGGIGTGIYIGSGSSPIIRNCAIHDNLNETVTTGYGVGIAISNADPIINGNLIYNNGFSGDVGNGCGIYVSNCSPVISGNTIASNSGGNSGAGIFIISDSVVTITNNVIENNTCSTGAGGGILIDAISSPAQHIITNNLFAGNSGTEGGGIYVSDGDPLIYNCTFAFNSGGGLYATSGYVVYCIFRGNTGYQIATSPSVNYSWVEGGFAGTGNITGVTLDFDTGPAGDYYLPEGHECIDAGYETASVVCFDNGFATQCLDSLTTYKKQTFDGDEVDLGFHYMHVPWTYYVPDDFVNIDNGLDTLMTGDSLIVRAGTYYESGLNFHGEGVVLVSEDGPEATTIDADGLAPVFRIQQGEGAETVIDGFTLREGYRSSYGGGIYCGGTDPTIRNCIIMLNNSDNGGGGVFCGSSQATISNCIFWANTVSGGDDVGGGLYIAAGGSNVIIDRCTFYGNTATQGAGIYAGDGVATITSTIIACNITGEGLYKSGPADVSLMCCNIYNNDGGDWLPPISPQYGIDHNISQDPIFCDAKNGNFALSNPSPCRLVPAECSTMGARDVGCVPSTCIVRADGSGDYATLQMAVDSLYGGDIIELADGVYTGTGNRDIGFKTKSVTVKSQSGNPASCIIDCQGESGDPHRGFVISEREGNWATIQGLTIKNGYHGSGGGGGVMIVRSNPTVRDCIIRDCEAFDGGGLSTFMCEPFIYNCQFYNNIGNDAAGGLFNNTSDATIEYCLFMGNWAKWGGGALYNHYSAPHVEHCTFVHNSSDFWGGAVHNNHPDSNPGIYNCTFVYNSAPNGGAIYSRNNANPSVVNSIIALSTQGEAAKCVSGAATDLYCCDVYGNAGGDYVDCLTGQLALFDNFSSDPLFCDSSEVNFRLQEASPCAPENNLACGLVGALPVGCSATDVETKEIIPLVHRLHHGYPNPFNPHCTIKYELAKPERVILKIYNVTGTCVRTLVDDLKERGIHKEIWDGRGDSSSALASGIYFYRIVAGDFIATRKIVLLR
jgi:predicted outer membrane repeat protein